MSSSLVLALTCVGPVAAPAHPSEAAGVETSLPFAFDPNRDAEEDFRQALRLASQTHRLILMDVGGDWCEACRNLDRFFVENPDLAARRDEAFVFLKVNYSAANKNSRLLGRMPFFFGYPHWFLIDETGRCVHSSFAVSDRNGFEQFLTEWGRPRLAAIPPA
jgi:thiol:disulfide interchange protein